MPPPPPPTPSTTAPLSLFFTITLPQPYNPSSPDPSDHEPPSDSQFAAFLHNAITALPEATQTLYQAAMRHLAPENTPVLTAEMRASLTSAVMGFVVHLPARDWDWDWEGDGEGSGALLTRLARGEVPERELVAAADTITAALRAMSGAGGSPAPSLPSSPAPSRSPTPLPAQNPNPGTPSPLSPARLPTATATATAPAAPGRSSPSGRSATTRTSALARDSNACVLTCLRTPLDVAHIIPFSVRGTKADDFWGFLSLFLGVEGAERVRGAALQLASGAAAGELVNCITLDASSHRHFDNGAIEILPVPGSGTWSGDYDPSMVSSYDVKLSFPGQGFPTFHRYVYSGTPPQPLLCNRLASGDVITLTTPDPARWPLPHPLLLQLHALCGRVKRLRAAAGWPVLPYGDGSGEGVECEEEEGEQEGWAEEEEEQEEEDRVEGRCWEGDEGIDGGVEAWVLGCGARTEPETEPETESGAAGNGRKRTLGAAFGEEGEVGVVGGEDEGQVQERPREVAVGMGEMGMREKERCGLAKGRRAAARKV